MVMLFKFEKWFILTAYVLLLGCQPLPRVAPQSIEIPKKSRNGTPITIHAQGFSQIAWWEKMHDPVLTELIHKGLVNNNQLQAAKANIQEAQAQLREARYAWLPTLNAYGNGFFGGGWESTITPEGPLARSQALSNSPTINFRGYFSGFVPRYSVNIWQNVENTKFAKAAVAMQQANYQSIKLTIISQICGAYFMLVGEKQQLRDEENYLNDLKKLRQLEWRRYRAGASDLTAITNIDQQIANQAASRVILKNSISQLENAIQTLLNANLAPISHHANLADLITDNVIPQTLPATVLKNRPDVMMALQNVTMKHANVGIAYANFFPSISLTSLLGAASIDLKNLLSVATGLWVAQGAILLPAIDGVSWEKIQAAKSGYLASVYNYLQTLRSALADVDNSLTTYQRTKEAYQYQAEVLTAARKAYALAASRYTTGFKDYRDILQAKLTVDTAQINLTLAKMQQLDSIVGVYQSVAAGIEKNQNV